MKFQFGAGSAQDPEKRWAETASIVNGHAQIVGDRMLIRRDLGGVHFGTCDGVFCRAMGVVDGVLYVVQGGNLYSVAENGVPALLGNVTDSEEVTISGNNGKVTVVSGGRYYVWNGTTLSQPSGAAFSSFGSVTYANQYTVLSELDGRKLQWSGLADATSLNGLDFATAEARDFPVLRVVQVSGQVMVFTTGSVETWYVPDIPRRIPGGVRDVGLKAFNLVTPYPDGCFFIGSDNVGYLTNGGELRAVSNSAVSTAIRTQDPRRVFYYEDDAHRFIVLTFRNQRAWKYDIGMGMWSERGEGLDLGEWTAEACAQAYGKFIIGKTFGAMQSLERVGTDGNDPLIMRVTGKTLDTGGKRFRVPRFRVAATVGTATTAESVELETSRDNGATWSEPKIKSLGAIGEYETEVVWRSLGQFRDMTGRLTYSGATDVAFDSTVDMAAA